MIDWALLNGRGASTRWTNLGFWKDARTYHAAAAELARRVGRAAQLREGDTVLDLGCGGADSCILWVREFGVARVVGVEPDPATAVEATERIRDEGLADRIVLRSDRAEWLSPSAICPGATAVVSVDAAYLFDTRANWLRALAMELPDGTRLGISDLFTSPDARRSVRVQRFAERAGIPLANLWTVREAEPVMADNGWRLTRLVRCAPEVLGGFARHAMARAIPFALHRAAGGWRALAMASAIGALSRGEGLDYGVISAVRTIKAFGAPQ